MSDKQIFDANLSVVQKDPDNMMGHLLLGLSYEKGKGTKIDKKKAFEHYGKAAKLGSLTGMFNCAILYRKHGQPELALKFFKKVSEANNGILSENKMDRDSQVQAQINYSNELVLQKNIKEAIKYLEIASKEPHPFGTMAKSNLGKLYLDQNEIQKAKKYLEMCVQYEDQNALWNLGEIYRLGLGGVTANELMIIVIKVAN